ncbi:MAG TPA: DUF6600 domain-containing protein [Kofleriaceae bacterium]|nr:DUF6600 domain-containing protein [Kofleriaceae bacterium]
MDFSVDVDASFGGEPVASVDVFYDQLAPYGVWLDDPSYGTVFTPARDDFEPYTNGHWIYTDAGMTWVSPDPFEWATAHYGRWAWSDYYDRWVWLPDTTWGPAWVEWRESGDDLGWAPLAPQVAIDIGYEPPVSVWHYCNAQHVLDAHVSRYYEPRERVVEIHREARPIQRYAEVSGTRVIAGPAPETLRARNVNVRPVRVDARQVGRMSPSDAQAAQRRAEQRRAADEQRNRDRIQRDANLRAKARPAQAPPAGPTMTPAPARSNTPIPQPQPQPQPQRQRQPEPQRQRQPEPQPPTQPPERTQPPTQPPHSPAEPGARAQPQPEPQRARPEPQRPEPKQTQRPPQRRGPTQRPQPPSDEPRPPSNQPTPPSDHPRPQPPAQVKPEPTPPAPRPIPPRAQPQPPRAQPQPHPQRGNERRDEHRKPHDR